MSFLGIDVGTTGCKACVFSETGAILSTGYCEYDIIQLHPGWAELDPRVIWEKIKEIIRQVVSQSNSDPVRAICVSSLGEAVVSVGKDRSILGNSLLNFDERGREYVDIFVEKCGKETLYRINGNILGNHYTATKVMWLRDHQPQIYEKTYQFLHWSSFVEFMLGAEPHVDFSLANRTLLFDIDKELWSSELFQLAGLDAEKFPRPVPSGTVVGTVSASVAKELGLQEKQVVIVSGAHDQCANALGCGVIKEKYSMLGMGTYFCIVPVFHSRPVPDKMIPFGLNTEHHAVPGCYVSFLYNHGGSLLKWVRNTCARDLIEKADRLNKDVYDLLTDELPQAPSPILVLPHFAPTGPPEFVSDSSGVMLGLRLGTSRGEVVRGIMEGVLFYLKECVEYAQNAGIEITEFRAVGGGSKSDAWLQIAADIFEKPVIRMEVSEAGALGGAILAGVATNVFSSFDEAVKVMTREGQIFNSSPSRSSLYARQFELYRRLWPMLREFLNEHAASVSGN